MAPDIRAVPTATLAAPFNTPCKVLVMPVNPAVSQLAGPLALLIAPIALPIELDDELTVVVVVVFVFRLLTEFIALIVCAIPIVAPDNIKPDICEESSCPVMTPALVNCV